MTKYDQQEARIETLERALAHERRVREDREARWRAAMRWATRATLASLAVGALIGFVRVAYAANCQQTLPAGLITFCAGDPALAKDINGNFATLVTQLTNKVGAWGSTDATMNNVTMKSATVSGSAAVMGNAAVTGSVTAASVTATGNVGAATLTATGDVAAASLHTTGDVGIAGIAYLGYHSKTCFPGNAPFNCACNANEVPLGGGVDCPNGMKWSAPWSGNGLSGWQGTCMNGNPSGVSVVCARLGL